MRNTPKNLQKKMAFAFVLAMFISTNSADAQETISYITKRTCSVKHAKGEEKMLTNFDRLNMRSYQEIDSIIVVIDESGDIETNIFHLSTTKMPDWVTKPYKTVIDKRGVKTFDNRGKVIIDFVHDKVALENYKQMKAAAKEKGYNHIPQFDEIPEPDIQEMGTKGMLVKKGKNGEVHIKNKNTELLYDVKNKLVENREFDANNELMFSLKQQFKQDEKGNLIPFYKREINLKRTSQGRRLWYFTEETTANYKRSKLLNGRHLNGNVAIAANLAVYPNPVTNILTVEIPSSLLQKEPVLLLLDATGREINRYTVSKSTCSLPVQNLSRGTYLLQLTTTDGLKTTTRFIKN